MADEIRAKANMQSSYGMMASHNQLHKRQYYTETVKAGAYEETKAKIDALKKALSD